jgi:hypothetical protein
MFIWQGYLGFSAADPKHIVPNEKKGESQDRPKDFILMIGRINVLLFFLT